MIEGHFLGEEDRAKLIALARDGLAVSRVTRRANALVLLDDGWSCRDVAAALLLDDDTVRNWRKLFEQRGIEGLTGFDMGGSAGFLSAAQEDALKVFVSTTLPRSTRHRRMDRKGVRSRLRKSLGADRTAASSRS